MVAFWPRACTIFQDANQGRKMNSPNRYGEINVKPAKGKLEVPLFSEDEYGMKREETADDPDWSHDPRSESAHEKHLHLERPPGPTEDQMAEKISLALFLNPEVNAGEITVTFSNGVMTLTGSVVSRSEKVATERTVETMDLVEDVLNQLQIRSKL